MGKRGSSIILGLMLGLVSSLYQGVMLALFVWLGIGWLIWRFSEPQEKVFLTKIFLLGLGVRLLLCLGLHSWSLLVGRDGSIFYDDAGIVRLAWRIAQYYKGNFGDYEDIWGERNLHSNFLATLFFFTGYSHLPGKLFNVLFGALTAVFVYLIAKNLFSRRIARLAALIMVFFPSSILWSAVNLKEAPISFLLSIFVWGMVNFQRTNKFKYVFCSIISVMGIYNIRVHLALSLALIFALSFLIYLRCSVIKKIMAILLIIFIIRFASFTGLYPLIGKITQILPTAYFNTDIFLSKHISYVKVGGSVYKILNNSFYSLSDSPKLSVLSPIFLVALLKGWFYFMSVPLPWQLDSKLDLAFYSIQMIFWVLLLPFMFLGILVSMRYYAKQSLLFILFVFIITSIFALSEGNVDAALRHRDMFTPFYLILISVGIMNLFSKGDAIINNIKC